MFRDYFGIEDNPFSNTPDPKYLFLSTRHQEALAHLQYGIQGSSGFVLLTGEVGTGKTTICRTLMEQLPDNVDLALCLNPRLSEAELLATICDELGIDTSDCSPTSIKDHTDALNRHLLLGYAKGRRAVLVIDEAQNLDSALLEQVRLLTNLETASTKLLQIILIGQPELRDMIDRVELRQLSQRITARYHLEPMDDLEVVKYIRHRLTVAGLDANLMDPGAIKEITLRSSGIPRLINSICERALLGAYAGGRKTIDAALVQKAADEVLGPSSRTAPAPKKAAAKWVFGGALAASVLLGALAVQSRDEAVQIFTNQNPAIVTAEKSAAAKNEKAPENIPEKAPEKAPPEEPEKAMTAPSVAEKTSSPAADEAAKVIDRLLTSGAVVRPGKTGQTKTAVAALPPETKTEPASAQAPAPAATGGAQPVSLDNLFRHPGVTGGLESAVARLFSLWNRKVSAFGGLNPCAEARNQGLRCLQHKGTLKRLGQMNRPAVISLVNAAGARRYAVLASLTETRATIDIDGRAVNAARDALAALWPGDFLMLWNPPPGLRATLRAGLSGKDVVLLRESLGKITGGGEKNSSRLFDAALKKQIMAFQKSRGLKEDGIVGTMTQIQLGLAISPSPVLNPALRAQR